MNGILPIFANWIFVYISQLNIYVYLPVENCVYLTNELIVFIYQLNNCVYLSVEQLCSFTNWINM